MHQLVIRQSKRSPACFSIIASVDNTMTRDEEIRHDLERQWREVEVEKTASDLGKVAQNFRESPTMTNGVVKRNTQNRRHSSD